MREGTRKSDTAQYPIVTRKMLTRTRRETLAVGDYHSAMVTLPQVTFEAVQEVFSTLYSVHAADPTYLFLSLADREPLAQSILHRPTRPGLMSTRILNEATKRLVHVISLPDLPQGTILCGFFGA